MNATDRAIRVTLRFGSRTDPELLQLLAASAPYARAKLLRELLAKGLVSGTIRSAPWSREPGLSVDQTLSVDAFNDDVMALLGKSVRL